MYQITCGLLAAAFVAQVSAQTKRVGLLWPVESRDFLSENHKDVFVEKAALLLARQSNQDPPLTSVAQCDTYDGYFYVTPKNYTWQLQCTTNYDGTLITQQNADNYSTCIGECVDYNRANGVGACLAITFNGPSDGALGLCTLWSSVNDVLLAYEEGNVQDSALLVRGPDGTIYATPQAAPSFSGQPSQPPTIDPVPTSTTSTTTIVSTSIIFVTSCPPGVPSCPALSSSPTVNSLFPTSTTPSASFSVSNGGVHPISATTPSQSPPYTPAPNTGVGSQKTFTTVKPYTEYVVEVVTVCAAGPDPCTVLTETSTATGSRTQLSCSPGVCTGAMINTQVDAEFTAATCIVTD